MPSSDGKRGRVAELDSAPQHGLLPHFSAGKGPSGPKMGLN